MQIRKCELNEVMKGNAWVEALLKGKKNKCECQGKISFASPPAESAIHHSEVQQHLLLLLVYTNGKQIESAGYKRCCYCPMFDTGPFTWTDNGA